MNYFRIITLINILFCIVMVSSCKMNQPHSDTPLPNLPKITNPAFESQSYGSEKIYHVTFEFDNSEYTPEEVVLFGVRQPLRSSNIQGNVVNVDVIHQTQKLEGYEVIPTELANGIIFKIDNITYLKTVNFKNSKK